MERKQPTSNLNPLAGDDTQVFRPQLFKLGSVLNGLETGASAMHKQILHVMAAVRSGTYYVDPVQLSRRIIGDSLRRCADAR